MRSTLAKQISDRDYARAQLIAEALWEHRDTEGLGNAYMAKLIGLPWRTLTQKERSKRRIYDLMGTVQRILAAEHPGYMVQRVGNGLAKVSSDPDVAVRQALPRLYKIHTAAVRADSEFDVIRRNSTSPVQHELAAGSRAIVAAIRAQIELAAAKEADRLNYAVDAI